MLNMSEFNISNCILIAVWRLTLIRSAPKLIESMHYRYSQLLALYFINVITTFKIPLVKCNLHHNRHRSSLPSSASNMTAKTGPDLIFGGATIGLNLSTVESVQELLRNLDELNISRIDTAGRYPPTSPGLSETLIGETKAAEKWFHHR